MPYSKNFLFGSATSSHQIEGGNTNSDWYAWEKMPGRIWDGETSLKGDSWQNYEKDVELLKNTNQNAYRLSIEWAKIEPKYGEFDLEAINHYRDQFQLLKKNNIKIMVTLFHFTLPKWFADEGGFEKSQNICKFVHFAKRMISEYGDLVDFWATLNEPNVYILKGYIEGKWCPGKKNYPLAIKTWLNFISAHNEAYLAMKSVKPKAQIGPVLSVMAFKPLNDNPINKLFAWFSRQFSYDLFTRLVIKNSDFIGLNYYIQTTIGLKTKSLNLEKIVKSDYQWEVHPEGLYRICKEQSKWGKPIYITENGTADADDKIRPQFIIDHLASLEKAIDEGVDVRGYFHWSLIDNFEWAAGYKMKFGLHTIDRKPRKSAQIYADLIKKYQSQPWQIPKFDVF